MPFFKSSTSSINTTAALAITVFLYVQYTGIRRLGPWGYIHHLLGSPTDAVTWALAPINLPIHLIGELAKPFSLALRLFGNITGEDILIAAFVSLGIMFMGIVRFPHRIPVSDSFHTFGDADLDHTGAGFYDAFDHIFRSWCCRTRSTLKIINN